MNQMTSSLLSVRNKKLIKIPQELLQAATPEGVLVKENTSFDSPISIVLPDSDRFDSESGCEIGTVIAVGSAVDKEEVDVGDVVLYRAYHGYPLPNGYLPSTVFKIDYPYSIVAVLSGNDGKGA